VTIDDDLSSSGLAKNSLLVSGRALSSRRARTRLSSAVATEDDAERVTGGVGETGSLLAFTRVRVAPRR